VKATIANAFAAHQSCTPGMLVLCNDNDTSKRIKHRTAPENRTKKVLGIGQIAMESAKEFAPRILWKMTNTKAVTLCPYAEQYHQRRNHLSNVDKIPKGRRQPDFGQSARTKPTPPITLDIP
jgi:hypothetical protein